ncbi:MAG: hypothetical protein K8F91_11540 [Candidatus Obscuribacterales bacterium]|nr:hypothetical protein [Candidatus Obscuribacterales bacterium]
MRHKGDQPANRDEKRPNRKFFERMPNQAPGLAKDADRSMYGQGDIPASAAGVSDWAAAQSEQVLVYHGDDDKPGGEDWMSQLKQNSMQFLADQRGVQLQEIYKESVYKTGIAVLVDKIYGLLQRYTFEFNQIAGGTDLHVSGTISGDVTEVTRYNRLREAEETATYFRCRFTTRHFALVVRGYQDTVEAYLMPVNMVMALSQSENQYPALCVVQVKMTEQGMMWRMRDGEPPIDTLDQLAMWLFTRLVDETKKCLGLDK